MKIVISPDSFKESLSAMEIAIEIEAGFQEIFPHAEYLKVPAADGGEGTVDAMIAATSGKRIDVTVSGPRGEPVQAYYGLLGNDGTAVIEMASASGLALVPANMRNPLKTSSYGTGEMIRSALDAGARRLILGIGGSATNDGGAGMLQALGVHLRDADGNEIGSGGAELARLASIDASSLDHRLKNCEIHVACDVDNPLTGPTGASAIFGPQKGATPEMVKQLDDNLRHYAEIIARDLGHRVDTIPGAGAAGGMGAAMLAFLNGRLRPGSEIVTEAIGLETTLIDADLVITGEGRIDSQSIRGKTPIGVARVAQVYGIPVIGIAGCLSPDAAIVHHHGIDAVFCAVRKACTVEEALQDAAFNVRSAARNIAAALRIGMQMGAEDRKRKTKRQAVV